jgi:hypothetical protein
MALSRALKEYGGFRKNPGKSGDPLTKNSPGAKGKTTKQYNQTGPKYEGPNYPQKNSSGEKGAKLKLII